ncbi:MAG: alpha/beta hydrolase [Candidatus Sumerlaeia bacterium]
MIRFLICALTMAIAGCSWGAAPAATPRPTPRTIPVPKPAQVINVYPGDAPGLVPGGRKETVVNERYVDVSVPQLLVYLPDKAKANGTALIICAGGGYKRLAMCLHVDNVARMLNDHGIAVFALKYRTQYGANNADADALADALRAVRIVRARAAEFGVDPRKIGIQGYSAGSTVCLNVLGHFDAGNAKAADAVERASSRPDYVLLMCPWPNGKTVGDYPIGKNAPPVFIAHARDDEAAPVEFAMGLDEELKRLGVKERTFVVDKGGHTAFHWGDVQGEGVKWPGLVFEWFKEIGIE